MFEKHFGLKHWVGVFVLILQQFPPPPKPNTLEDISNNQMLSLKHKHIIIFPQLFFSFKHFK